MERDHKKIIDFFERKKRMPSYQEMADVYGFKSKNAAHALAKKFIEAGYIKKDSTGKLLPVAMEKKIPLLGFVQAGFPTVGEETMNDVMSLDDWLISDHDASYILTVNGDSMKDAGIVEGDYVVVERGVEAAAGDIVIAEVDGEWTMKYLRKKNNKLYLEAANKKYPDIHPEEELNINAVVKSVVRKYGK